MLPMWHRQAAPRALTPRAKTRIPPPRRKGIARRRYPLRGLARVGVTRDGMLPNGQAADRSIRHILIVAYLYPPCNVASAHRPAGLRNAFESAGIRTTVLTSEISGALEDDEAQRIIRAGDLRTRFRTQYQTLVGYRDAPLEARGAPRWWTNYIVPDPTALSWFPQALVQLLRLIRNDRPDVIVTTSGPESSHLLGLVASAFGIRWVADYRDGWLRDMRHPAPLRVIDRALERRVARRATVVTAVNDAIAADVADGHGVPAFTISNGFDRAALAGASDERASLDPARFSLVHTGLLAIDLDEPVLHRGKDARAFLDALTLLLAEYPDFATRLELVVAGPVSDTEREILLRGDLSKIVRVLGLLPRARALGLQQAADGLLLIPGGAGATTAKIYEYLAACKPIFAVTEQEGVAAALLCQAGEHTIAEAGDSEALAGALHAYLARWTGGVAYEPRRSFDLQAHEYESLGRKLLQLLPREPSPRATLMSRLRTELEYIRLMRPTAFVRATALDARDALLRRQHDPLTPPRRLGFVGSGDFRAAGEDFRELFVNLAGLHPDEDVLDVGSGVGRVAVGLTGWLRGRYEGIDVVRRGIEWCQQSITPRYPNFRFQVADLYNRHYNPEGRVRASEYRFPFEDQSFDVVVLTSVFTHLLPADRDNYISEIARVLRPAGRCFGTFFLLDDDVRRRLQGGRDTLNFRFQRPGYWTDNRRIPEAAVAYEEADVREQFERNGLRITLVRYGAWSGRDDGTGWQDIVVAAGGST
jgi:SAM-dependent methyltransferase